MKPLIGTHRPVFRVGEKRYYWEDVILGGILRGEWAEFEGRVRDELACVRRQQSTGAPLPDADIETAAGEFRYARSLVSAAEMHAWLDAWGLSVGEWLRFIRRSYLRDHMGEGLKEVVAGFAASPRDLSAALPVSFVCSGVAARFARRLARRAAANERVGSLHSAADVDDLLARFPSNIDLSPFGSINAERLREHELVVAGLEPAYDHFCRQVLTPQRLQRAIETRQLDWIRVDYRTVVFKRKSIAREAVLCVRDDGLDVEVVAQQAGAAVHSASECLADLSNEMRDRLLTARAGELIGPVAKDGAFVVHQIDAKRLPSLDDPAVRERVEARVLRQALDAAVDDLVQWYVEL